VSNAWYSQILHRLNRNSLKFYHSRERKEGENSSTRITKELTTSSFDNFQDETTHLHVSVPALAGGIASAIGWC
jgi:hypothetical protein